MTYVITEACIDVLDASCVEVCPVECIHHDEEDRICFIDPGSCTDCDVCVSACPVGAIFADMDTPTVSLQFVEINALWFKDKSAARQKVTDEAD
ncbi:MAG TPA: 4Fe-4S dicluster domain-containing protein [Gammaproteobacteria bacterium]|nr:4Fe-4S dicluster domain-containing protein [Gammaproteobacteria bacterium]HIK71595.1 4Fe-4S dicluster domain-containing protein [Pseudomonadales bacterium]|tara:strand:+ start:301 stop:582 length:282 start_codon:yes stop_codon:yes gene_type:complete